MRKLLPLKQAIRATQKQLIAVNTDIIKTIVARLYLELKYKANEIRETGRFQHSIAISESPLFPVAPEGEYPYEQETLEQVKDRISNASIYRVGSNVPYVYSIEYGGNGKEGHAIFRLTLEEMVRQFNLK